jgi:hypothetical protein
VVDTFEPDVGDKVVEAYTVLDNVGNQILFFFDAQVGFETQHEMKPLAGRRWWSFYESDANFENPRAQCALPWPAREAQLLPHLNDKPYLLYELRHAFRPRWARAYPDRLSSQGCELPSREYDEKTANGVVGAIGLPTSAAQSFVGQHRADLTPSAAAGSSL